MVRSGPRGQHRFIQCPQPAGRLESPAMHTLNPQWAVVATGGSAVYPRPRQSAWQQAFLALRAPVWPAILATVCAGGLLLAFQHVVHAGVQQGEARNRATAAHADAVWRCDFLRDESQRASCHVQLNASRRVDATLNPTGRSQPEAVALASR